MADIKLKKPEIPGSSLEDIEKYAIIKTLSEVGWSAKKAADVLKISTRKIQYDLKKWGYLINEKHEFTTEGAQNDLQ